MSRVLYAYYTRRIISTTFDNLPVARYRKLWRTCELIYKEEGVAGLYGGWVLHLYKTIPFTIITFLVYEGLLDKFRQSSKQKY